MTVRSILLGLALGVFVSAFTHFNDMFIQGSWFISNHLPIGVLGVLVVGILVLNPLLRAMGSGLSLRAGELAIIVALGLASCGWPSFSYFRYFVTITAFPAHGQGTQPHWQSSGVMRYLPGGDPQLAEGHVQDWSALVLAVADEQQRDREPVLERMWSLLPSGQQNIIQRFADQGNVPLDSRAVVLRAVNVALTSGDLTPQPPPEMDALPAPMRGLVEAHGDEPLTGRALVRLNRWWLTSVLPEAVMPPPRGDGVMLLGAAPGHDVLDTVVAGADAPLGISELPWSAWWPVIRVWGSIGLLLGLASLCLTLIVHPQWSRRELLPYPIARFVNELSERDGDAWLPRIASSRLFWFGMGAMVLVHGVNGLHAWFEAVPEIPLRLAFEPLSELFPTFSRVSGTGELFRPYIYFSVIAFCFFLATPVSFSLGASTFAYGLLGAALLSAGISFDNEYIGAGKGNMLRFGAYVGMAGIILYIGRRYYLSVVASAVGLPRAADVPSYAVWAMRGLVVLFAVLVVLFYTAGLSWGIASVFILMLLLLFLVVTRIVVETGMFFVQVWWMPVGILTGLLGFEAIGPTTYLVLAIGSVLLVGDPRTLLMPYLANGLQVAERAEAAKPGRLAPWLTVMLLVGFVVAGVALFSLAHNRGPGIASTWDTQTLPNMPFEFASRYIAESSAQDTLSQATAASGLDRLANARFDSTMWGWMVLGLVLLVGTAVARLRLPWWPIHPVLFLVWGTMPASRLGVSFMIGWLVKVLVVQVSGSRGYRQLLPLMVGIIAGELLMGLVWSGVSGVYYGVQETAPPVYRIYP
ncbi:DUF6785 family protein [Phycisphaerales bacterium AB-hyl4]|uniref:DUF6785 family protein n=1 Tax=Natronomicrosphaera hydrolytica TaxID=3242702 RepID=A0ABV4U3Y8_9BACT